jgi:hypothetical protein
VSTVKPGIFVLACCLDLDLALEFGFAFSLGLRVGMVEQIPG